MKKKKKLRSKQTFLQPARNSFWKEAARWFSCAAFAYFMVVAVVTIFENKELREFEIKAVVV